MLSRRLNILNLNIFKQLQIRPKRPFSSESHEKPVEEENYLKVHENNLFWFPSKSQDSREIGPYPSSTKASNDPSQSFQFRPPDLEEYFSRQQRRKFNEPVPEEAEFQGTWNVDIEGNYSVIYMLSGVGLLLGGLSGIAYFSTMAHDPLKSPRRLAVEKELPYTSKYFPNQQEPRPIYTWTQ